ncbi:cyclase family protein [Rubrobacter calidifluminis]|uniref:cyclase family protein n=1 Tax=Rubrobacter calidifluminis TaxID=1392640 RepID=UPI00235EF694|nr:cyclase family protein [Rubrobacter calidifluminis]
MRLPEGARIFDLEQPRTEAMPVYPAHRPGYSYLLHRRHEDEYEPETSGPRSSASGIIFCTDHTGTHIDAICHQSKDLRLHGSIPVGEAQGTRGFSTLGVEEIPPIVAPGVLLDVAAKEEAGALEPGYAVTAEDLAECCRRQGVEVPEGGVVLVRTGNARRWDDVESYLAGPGVSTEASRWLADRGVAAVGADNVAWDVPGRRDPELGCLLPGHLILLVERGIYIVENLMLEELSSEEVYGFLFVCAPPKFVGATGAPVRPLAIAGPRG